MRPVTRPAAKKCLTSDRNQITRLDRRSSCSRPMRWLSWEWKAAVPIEFISLFLSFTVFQPLRRAESTDCTAATFACVRANSIAVIVTSLIDGLIATTTRTNERTLMAGGHLILHSCFVKATRDEGFVSGRSRRRRQLETCNLNFEIAHCSKDATHSLQECKAKHNSKGRT